jgi:hypothetical protein
MAGNVSLVKIPCPHCGKHLYFDPEQVPSNIPYVVEKPRFKLKQLVSFRWKRCKVIGSQVGKCGYVREQPNLHKILYKLSYVDTAGNLKGVPFETYDFNIVEIQ